MAYAFKELGVIALGLVLIGAAISLLSRDSAARAAVLFSPISASAEPFYDGFKGKTQRNGYNEDGTAELCAMNPGMCNDTGDVNVQGKLFFGDSSMSTSPCPNGDCSRSRNNTDPYYLEKVQKGFNNSSLRLTINDDADESLQVWGNSCAIGDCYGPGALQHKFRGDGAVAHRGGMTVGSEQTTQEAWGFNYGVSTFNPHMGWWSHFPWKDGTNYIRGDTVVKGALLAENPDPGPMLERRYAKWQEGDRYGIGQFSSGATRVYAASANTYDNSSVSLSFARPNGQFKDVLVATNKGDKPVVSVKGQLNAPSLGGSKWNVTQDGVGSGWWNRITRPGDLVITNTSNNGGDNDSANGITLAPWNSPGGLRVHGGGATVNGKLCVGSTCVTEDDLKQMKAGGGVGGGGGGPVKVGDRWVIEEEGGQYLVFRDTQCGGDNRVAVGPCPGNKKFI